MIRKLLTLRLTPALVFQVTVLFLITVAVITGAVILSSAAKNLSEDGNLNENVILQVLGIESGESKEDEKQIFTPTNKDIYAKAADERGNSYYFDGQMANDYVRAKYCFEIKAQSAVPMGEPKSESCSFRMVASPSYDGEVSDETFDIFATMFADGTMTYEDNLYFVRHLDSYRQYVEGVLAETLDEMAPEGSTVEFTVSNMRNSQDCSLGQRITECLGDMTSTITLSITGGDVLEDGAIDEICRACSDRLSEAGLNGTLKVTSKQTSSNIVATNKSVADFAAKPKSE